MILKTNQIQISVSKAQFEIGHFLTNNCSIQKIILGKNQNGNKKLAQGNHFVLLFILLISGLFATAQPSASWNYSTQTGNLGSTYDWIDCSTGTSIVSGDDAVGSFSWPFTFKFYDNVYTAANQLSVSTNGFIRLDGTASTDWKAAKNYTLGSNATNLGQILALGVFDNAIGSNNGYCNYLVTGSEPNRILTVEYNNMEIRSGDNSYTTTQVSFYETLNKVVLKFQNENIKKNGADLGIHSGVSSFFNSWGQINNFSANTWIEYSPDASIIVNPTSIAFGYIAEGLTSTEQTFTVFGTDLNNPPGNISVTAPANFEVSLQSGTGFNSGINIPYLGSDLATTTVYARFKPTAADVDYNGNIDVSGGGATAQTVLVSGTSSIPGYCTFNFNAVKPITLVSINNLNNTDRNINNRISYEDYTTAISPADLFTGGTFVLTIEGVVDQFETISYTAYFDWNHDGDFIDAGESFQIGTISNSNGNDGNQAVSSITIPGSNIALGITRMRIIGDNEGYSNNPCSKNKNKSNGQIHDYSVNVANPTFTWEGTQSSDWNNSGNWSDGVVPGSNDEVTIPDLTTGISWPIITAAPGVIKDLIIESSESGTGSIIIDGGSLTVSGNINVEQYVPSDDWHNISSPVAGQQLGSFASTNNLGTFEGTYDIAPYSESDGEWGPFDVLAGTSTQFAKSAGYLSRLPLGGGNRVITFEGSSIYSGTINRSIAYTRNGWNSVGNPYTSAIKATGSGSFLEANVASGNIHPDFAGIYVWNHSIWDYDVYSASTPLNISMTQGFVVKSKTGGGTVQFTPSMQIHSNVGLKSEEITWPKIKLSIWSPEAENNTTINFDNSVTEGFDMMYDINKLKGNRDIALYTKMPGNEKHELAIQALPIIAMEDIVIPVGVDCWLSAEYEFEADIEGLPKHIDVIFEDRKEKIRTVLSEAKNRYNTTVDSLEMGAGRFYLILKSNTTNTETNIELKPFKVFTRDKIIYIDGPSNNFTTYSLYSVDGKMWFNKKAESLNRNTIDSSEFPAGIYLLKIDHEGKRQTEKLVIM